MFRFDAIRVVCAAAVAAWAVLSFSQAFSGDPGSLRIDRVGDQQRVVLVDGFGAETVLRETTAEARGERLVRVADAGVSFASWDETSADGETHWVTLSKDGGASWSRPRALDFTIPLRAGRLVPGIEFPAVAGDLRARADGRLFVVQFETTGLDAWRRGLERLGAEVLSYLPQHAHVVRMDPALVPAVRAQPYVRWVGPYEPGWKIEPEVLAGIAGASTSQAPRRYHLMTLTAGVTAKERLAADVRAAGGRVDVMTPNGYRLEATLTLDQVARSAHSDHLLWLDRWTPRETDMDVVREVAGSNYVEGVAGYAGQGVRGEVMDAGIQQDHPDFDGLLIHGPAPSVDSHGTSTYGIVFGNGNRDGDGQAKGTGHMPAKEAGWFYDYDSLTDRYQETAELVSAPINGVFQSNSWGDARTRAYTSISQEMDDIIWRYDVAIFQSQSNAGNQDSRPQAWAKNIISVGAVNHYDTATLADDCWCSGASIGPAEDGRIKPDLAYWYDSIYTTTTGSGYTSGFGGTSAATPITAGIGGLVLQMWADNVLGNNPEGTTVFEKRPHAATTKALLINTAEPYPFSGTASDLTRVHQGWGLPSAKRFYDRRGLIEVVDEDNVLRELDTHVYTGDVPAGQAELKVTLVYTDRAGTSASTLHRINDVTLKVTDPTGQVVYWGNAGLQDGNWSTPGGGPDALNNVENVFIPSPAAGLWTIEVSADDLNQDQHVETPEVDQDYALVVYGVTSLQLGCPSAPPSPTDLAAVQAGDNRIDLAWSGTPSARGYRVYRASGGCGGTFAAIGATAAGTTDFVDASASGGLIYGYEVRANEGCLSEPTVCVEATAAGPCILPPAFAGVGTVSDDGTPSCGVTVQWTPATGACGGPLAYNVYRGTSPSFVPSAATRVASCVPGTSWSDDRKLQTNVEYWYLVRAEDLGGRGSAECGGVREANTVTRSARPRGAFGQLLSDGFEAGLEGWTVSAGTPAATAGAWVAGTPSGSTSGGLPASPSACPTGAGCLFTELNKGGNAKNGDVDGGETIVSSPEFDASSFATAELSYVRWHFNDGVYNDSGDRFALDVSRDGGTTWTTLDALGARQSANAWTPRSFALESGGPLTSRMRLRARSADGLLADGIIESGLDDVAITGFAACTTAAAAAPGGATGTLTVGKDTASSRLAIAWGADCGGGTGFGLYRGDLAVGWASAAPVPGHCGIGATAAYVDPGEGSSFFVVAPNDGVSEGSFGLRSDGTRRPRPVSTCAPEAPVIDACAP